MFEIIIVFILIVSMLAIIMPILAIVKASSARRQAEEVSERLAKLTTEQGARIARLEAQVRALKANTRDPQTYQPKPQRWGSSDFLKTQEPLKAAAEVEHTEPPELVGSVEEIPIKLAVPEVESISPPSITRLRNQEPDIEPTTFKATRPIYDQDQPAPKINFEQFVGGKLIGWIGGLALFLGIIFAVKYSFENNLIPPSARIALGFLSGLGLVIGGLWVHKQKAYQALAQTLSAAGILVLYGVTFAAQSLYHLFPPMLTFGVMSLITVTGFTLAVRLRAQVVAILGMVGGFLTPILCSTGQDNPLGLFSYIALLDIGLIAVAKYRRWLHLTALGAGGTALMQWGWAAEFFNAGRYYIGSKTIDAMAIFLGFAALFAAATWWSKRREDEDAFPALSALGMSATAMIAAFVMLDYGSITERSALFYGFVMLINIAALFVAWVEPRVRAAPSLVGAATFVHLCIWTVNRLTMAMLPTALGIYLVFGLLHTAFGLLWQRKHENLPATAAPWMPVVTLVLMMLPLFGLHGVSFQLWPAMLLVNVAIFGLAWVTCRLLPVLFGIVLTLVGVFFWLTLPAHHHAFALPTFLLVVGGFAIIFIGASLFLSTRIDEQDNQIWGISLNSALPICSAVMPFALLIIAVQELHVTNPMPVFGLALMLSGFLLAMTRMTRTQGLGLAALACVLLLEYSWHDHTFDLDKPVQPLLWYLGFYALFAAFPFAFRQHFRNTKLPWITAALAGVGTFELVHQVFLQAWPQTPVGLIAAAFAIPPLMSLIVILKQHREDSPARLSQLAWFGGVSLFFITLIFPLQFDRQWLTIAWALEGAALCWLFQRVPHKGLHWTALGLLTVAFIRLALNPEVLSYHERSGAPIFNWFLYTYGLVAAAQFAAIKLIRPPHEQLGPINLHGLFGTFGGVLLFLLLNIEIADYFTEPEEQFITFMFSGNFARDMCYSIGWGLFSLGLLIIGFKLEMRRVRFAGIGLMVMTLLKLFLHDLANIDSIYRIGALLAVAIIALAASFLYQRFLARDSDP